MIKSHTKRSGVALYFILTLLFISGTVAGALFARLSTESFVFQRALLTKNELFANSFISFLKPCFLIWLSGFFNFSIYLDSAVLAYRGGLLGFTIGLIFKEYGLKKGLVSALSATLPQNLFFLPFLLLLSSASTGHKNMKGNSAYLVLLVLSVAVAAFSAFADTYITSWLINFTL